MFAFFYLGAALFGGIYARDKLTDTLHEICGFRTDYEFIPKSKMKKIQKESKVQFTRDYTG